MKTISSILLIFISFFAKGQIESDVSAHDFENQVRKILCETDIHKYKEIEFSCQEIGGWEDTLRSKLFYYF